MHSLRFVGLVVMYMAMLAAYFVFSLDQIAQFAESLYTGVFGRGEEVFSILYIIKRALFVGVILMLGSTFATLFRCMFYGEKYSLPADSGLSGFLWVMFCIYFVTTPLLGHLHVFAGGASSPESIDQVMMYYFVLLFCRCAALFLVFLCPLIILKDLVCCIYNYIRLRSGDERIHI